MKKRFFGLFIIATVMLASVLSFASCGNDGVSASGFTVSETSDPILNYNGQNNTTAVTLYVRVTNQTRTTVDSLSFFAEFRDSGGRILDSRICNFDFPLSSGESKSISYDFKATDISDTSVISGRVASVTYSPCSMQLAGSSASLIVESEEEPLGGFAVFMIVLGVIFCIALIVIGIVMIVIGVDDMEGWMVVCGIIVIVVAVFFGISFIVLA